MDEETKEALVAQFRAYLEAEQPPAAEEAASDREVDLFTLFTELAALKNEVRLESRQVKDALDRFRGLLDTLGESNRQLARELENHREQENRAQQDAERPLLLEVLDLHDRLGAGLDAARGYHPSLTKRLTGTSERFIAELAGGMEITQRRLDDLLVRYGVEPVAVRETDLDPHTMRAAGVEHHEDRRDGVVLAEIRKGFTRNGGALRLADVIVNKKAEPS